VTSATPISGACSSSNGHSDLLSRAVSIAYIRADHPGPAFNILDFLLEMLNRELWGD
jgi:hypothetical protein